MTQPSSSAAISPLPTPENPLRLGTRNSPLAMAQAEETKARLIAAHDLAADSVVLVSVLASGDRVLDRPLAEIGGKALWTKELDGWLLTDAIDASVHSLKDVETLRPDGMVIAAILPREDVRDCLVGAQSLADLPAGARIGTSAPRRAAQALHARPDCTVVTFRGNVARRLARLADGEADATLLAAAGLARLDQMHVGTPLDPESWIPAPAQGAIAIECRSDDTRTQALLAAIDDAPSRASAMAERAFLMALGGNCHSPIAVHTTFPDTEVEEEKSPLTLQMSAALFSPCGQYRVDGNARFLDSDTQGPARLAAELLDRASPAIAEHFGGPEVFRPNNQAPQRTVKP